LVASLSSPLRHELLCVLHRLLLVPFAQIGLLVLRVNRHQKNRNFLVVEIIDHPCAAALAATTASDAQLAQAAGARNQIAAGRIIGDQIDHRVLLGLREEFIGPPLVAGEFGHRDGTAAHAPEYPNGARPSISAPSTSCRGTAGGDAALALGALCPRGAAGGGEERTGVVGGEVTLFIDGEGVTICDIHSIDRRMKSIVFCLNFRAIVSA
jgi:hypothetical protein